MIPNHRFKQSIYIATVSFRRSKDGKKGVIQIKHCLPVSRIQFNNRHKLQYSETLSLTIRWIYKYPVKTLIVGICKKILSSSANENAFVSASRYFE